ncbi:MAG: LPS assembly protein LptD [Pseudomonadota bacterium]|nr:LPS assembly protein LptD [Pseudomonadota bacterium]
MNMKFAYTKNKFFLSAETISKNDANNTIKAEGNVNLTNNEYKLKANEITYFYKEKKVFAKGNVIIIEKNANVIYASQAELSNDLKSNFIKNIGILLSDNSRLAASSAKSIKDSNKTIYSNVVFTKCKSCKERTNESIMWKLKAKKATHLKNSKIILYENVYLEAFNIPILFVPIFYHPDPSVKSKTGLLTPKISSTNTFGTVYEQPIFFNFSNTSNLTTKARLSSKEGLFILNDHNVISDKSNLKLKYSITEGTKVRINETTKKEIRGHLDLKYIHKNNGNWVYGVNIKRSSDKSYLSKYDLSEGENVLNQNIFTEWGNLYKKASFDFFKFQSLSDEYLVSNLPFIRPSISFESNNLNKKKRNRNSSFKISFNSVSRKNNKNVDSIHLQTRNNKTYLYNGFLIKDFNIFNIDAYNENGTFNNKSLVKLFPKLGIETQYPLISYSKKSSFLIEPKVQLFISPDDYYNNKIRNEDSLELDLNSSNLFNYDRYSGNDRKESGTRLNYGILLKRINLNGDSLSGSLGQTYNNNKQELFNKNSGFKNKRSEIVGNIIFKDATYDLSYDYRLSENLNLNRNNFNVQTKSKNLGLNLSYIQLKDFASTVNSDTEQINYGFSYGINKVWNMNFYQLRDLAGATYSAPLKTNISVKFSNECTSLQFSYTSDRSYNVDIPAATNLSFNIKLFGF